MLDNETPPICEILDVEVNEEFDVGIAVMETRGEQVARNEILVFRIDGNGDLQQLCNGTWRRDNGSARYLIDVINGKLKIAKKLRWTPEDIEGAKAIRLICPDAVSVTREETGVIIVKVEKTSIPDYMVLRSNCGDVFPSLKPGKTVALDEILEAEHG